jgi:hypothetical protein
MPSEPAYIRNFKRVLKGEVTAADLPTIERELYGGSDRARAVLLAAFVEAALQTFVQAQLRPTFLAEDFRLLFGANAPLGTFSAKILIAFAFNWYGPDTRHDLDLIRELRNGFAHSRSSFTFETAEVAAVCRQLRSPDSPGSFIPKGYLEAVSDSELRAASDKNHPRTRYIMTCHVVSHRLLSNSGAATGVISNQLDMP